MEHTYDSVGHKKEVIVIDDSQTPEHPPRKRTRAQVAAETAAIAAGRGQSGYANGIGNGLSQNGHLYNNGTTAHSVASTSSAGKKRKVDEGSDPAKKKGKVAVSHPVEEADLSLMTGRNLVCSKDHQRPTSATCPRESDEYMGRCRRSLYCQTRRYHRSQVCVHPSSIKRC